MTCPAHPRLAWRHLEAFCHRAFFDNLQRTVNAEAQQAWRRDGRLLTDAELAHILGVHRGQILRWRRGDVPFWRGHAIATELGVHPSYIWPEYRSAFDTNDELIAV